MATPVVAGRRCGQQASRLVVGAVAWLVLGLFVGGLALSDGHATVPSVFLTAFTLIS